MKEPRAWDFFIAHAGTDQQTAQDLYRLLVLHSRVFLDSECLLPGDDWDLELALAQHNSRITIVLISSKIENAYYTREEIASAIAMAREDKHKHRIVPIYLDAKIDNVPYGLRLKHGFSISSKSNLKTISGHLLQLLTRLGEVPNKTQSQELSNKTTVEDTHESQRDDLAQVEDSFLAARINNNGFAAQVSPDLKTLALAVSVPKKVINLINTRTGESQLHISAGDNGLRYASTLQFSPDGSMLLVCGKLFNVLTGELIRVFFHKNVSFWSRDPVFGVVFSPDGRMLAGVCADKTVKLWDVATGAIRHIFQYDKECDSAFDFSPCSKYFAYVFNSRTLNIWDWATDQTNEVIQADQYITYVKFSPDGNLLATTEGSALSKWDSGSKDMSVKLRYRLTGQLTNTHQHLQPTRLPVLFSPTNEIIAVSTKDRRSVRLHQVRTGRLIKEIFPLETMIKPLSFSRSGRFLACVEWNMRNIVWRLLPLDL